MKTDTDASPSENTICEMAPLRPPMERLASINLRNPGSGLVSTQPESPLAAGAGLYPDFSTCQFWVRLFSAYFDLTRSRLKPPPILNCVNANDSTGSPFSVIVCARSGSPDAVSAQK